MAAGHRNGERGRMRQHSRAKKQRKNRDLFYRRHDAHDALDIVIVKPESDAEEIVENVEVEWIVEAGGQVERASPGPAFGRKQ